MRSVARTGSARGVVPRKRGERTPVRPKSERMRKGGGRRKAMQLAERATQASRHSVGVKYRLVPGYQLPGRTRLATRPYQDQLRQSPELPATVQVALDALPVSS